ncbi:hypothetical protein J7T55_007430 [Diaporthe amygdali]|uniref:uncharacterized protein n=1 Tax=Phomopsis amygdali TaxID=1214568 RepID=UPI0022FE4334|nr:uncharacterized protein J7T55_007430 [Diaporthe amygdali]KAJ0116450.1 hypothetical protein J7T55_007430 [Diaporthe amygdali]
MSLKQTYDADDVDFGEVWDKMKRVAFKIWSRTTRRVRFVVVLLSFLIITTVVSRDFMQNVALDDYITVPKVSLQYASEQRTPFNESKVALLIENRANPILSPLMLHFISVVPPDWRFRFMGSVESVEHLNKSVAIREQVNLGKLDLTYIPSNMSVSSQEEISRFLTTLWLYETVLAPAEWLLIFQTDSILCANSQLNLNDFLDYDWIGAPWNPGSRFGGNGGLSIRRVSAIVDVLRSQARADFSEAEDVWLTERLGHRPNARMANSTVSLTFSGEMHTGKPTHLSSDKETAQYNSTLEAAEAGELVKGIDDWREGFYEPMGYHTGGGGSYLHSQIWGSPRLRKHIWDYCPEVKMTIAMDAAKYVPGSCGAYWKRDVLGNDYSMDPTGSLEADLGYGTEIIDGEEYPLLPDGLVPF